MRLKRHTTSRAIASLATTVAIALPGFAVAVPQAVAAPQAGKAAQTAGTSVNIAGIEVPPELAGMASAVEELQKNLKNLPVPSPAELEGLTDGLGDVVNLIPRVPNLFKSTTTQVIHVGQRRALVETPQNFDPTVAHDVILAFGGWRESPEKARSYQGWNTITGGKAIVVYPQGINNAWGGAPYAATDRATDVKFVEQVVAKVKAQYPVKRVFAAGMSNGGGMALALACQRPDLVNAVAAVSGAFYNPTVAGCANQPVATLIIHGTKDPVIPVSGGSKHGAPLRSAASVFKQFATRNGCQDPAVAAVTEAAARRGVSVDATRCAKPTRIVTVRNGGHQWFRSPLAEGTIWRFFNSVR